MEPIAIWVRPDGEWAIVHRCQRCSTFRSNRIAGDDDPTMLLCLAKRPLDHPAFPITHDSPEGGA
jgi:ribosome biogenesis GTPase